MAHRDVQYRADQRLASFAQRLRKESGRACAIAPLILMSDPRLADIEAAATALPHGSCVIYRHFGAESREMIANSLRQICFARSHQFLIGNDPELAITCGADGVHFAQKSAGQVTLWQARCPDWLLTIAAHDQESVERANAMPVHAVTLSPIFESDSPSADSPLGIDAFCALISRANHPVFALGGVNSGNFGQLSGTGAAGIAGVSGIVNRI